MKTLTKQQERQAIEAAQSLGPVMARMAEVSRRDPAVFCQFVLRDEMTGQPIRLAPMHEEWHDVLNVRKRAVIWTHTEGGKSSQLSVGRALWEIGKNSSIRILILSSSSGAAKKIVKSIKNYIENSATYRTVFPDITPDKSATTGMWRDDAFIVRRSTMAKDPTVQASGYGGNVHTGRFDLIIIDDYLTAENTYSQHNRDKYYSWLKSTIETRRTTGGRLWFVGNAWHIDDAMHRYAAEPGAFAKKYPVLDANGVSSWPEVWPQSRITEEIAIRGPIESRRTMFCDPVADADRKFKLEYIQTALTNGDGMELIYALQTVPTGMSTVTGVDLAVTKATSGDETAAVTIAVEHKRQVRQILDITAGRMSGPETVQMIVDLHRRYNSLVIVESNACFIPGSLVLTRDRGYVPIESIAVGDLTWTHRGRWRRVSEVIHGTGRRVTPARASGSVQVTATPNHWFYMREAGRTPGRGGGHYIPIGDPTWISCGFAEKLAYTAIAVPRWDSTRPVLSLPGTGRPLNGKRRDGQRGSREREVTVDADIAMLLGLWMAEGHTSKAQICLTLGKGEMYMAEWAASVFRRIVPNRQVSITRKGSIIRVCANSTALARAMKFGVSVDKCLPLEWLGWPLDLRLAVVRGWLLGDGCCRVNNKRLKSAASTMSGITISRNWAMWARATLFEAGMKPTLTAVKPKTNTIDGRTIHGKRAWQIGLAPTDVFTLLRERTEIEHTRWGRLVDGRHQRAHSPMHFGDGHVWAYLRRGPGVFEAYEGPVYNLTVEEDHSFTVDDYIVHNAQKYIKQFVNDQSAVPVRAFYTGKNKYDPAFGIESLAIEFSASKWIVPNRGGTTAGFNARMAPEVKKLINEMLSYDPQSHTGDRLMALWLSREGARPSAAPPGQGKRPRRT